MSYRNNAETKIYPERSGINVAEHVEILLSEPEAPLDDEERISALVFESELADTELSSGRTLEIAILDQQATDIIAPYVSGVSLVEGNAANGDIEVPGFEDSEEARKWLVALAASGADSAQLRQIAKRSMESFKGRVVDMLVNGQISKEDMESPSPVIVEPERLISQSSDMNEAREILLARRAEYGRYADGLDGAKRAIIDIYLARVNSEIAKNIPMLDCLLKQSAAIEDHDTASAVSELLPASLLDAIEKAESRQRFFEKLDFLRNGADQDQAEFSAVSSKLEAISGDEAAGESLQPLFTPEQVVKLKEHMVEPGDALMIMRRIINKAGLLSQFEPDEKVVNRSGRAPDELFQVIINPGKSTFAVDGPRGLYKVSSEPASLYRLLVTAGAHELQHINQSQVNRQVGEYLRIAKIKGKQISMFGEAGANQVERKLERELFGSSKSFSLTYAKALQALGEGGNYFDAARAFYEEKRRVFPDINPFDAALEASDRVLRLTNFGGHSSQALVYAEEGIMQRELAHLPSGMQARATAFTGLNPADQVKLHRYGLLPEIASGYIDWTDIVLDETKEIINAAIYND